MKTPLPMDDSLASIGAELQNHSAVVVTAAPGAGKTTRLPPAALDWVSGKVLVLEPRRMAAIAAAARIAEENQWTPGQEVGWQVRFDNQSTPETRLVFLTEALLARRMVSDPELQGVDLVILDEFHERSLHTDLTLGLLQELRQMGREIKLVIMSATLAAEKISDYLNGAPIISVPGKLFPLEIIPRKTPQRLRTDEDFYSGLVETVKTAAKSSAKDILVFLPGVGEIERSRERLHAWAQNEGRQLVTLHGSLPLEEQRKVLRRSETPRVILSTNLAESSVTVDGVDTVIDSGLAKISRYDVKTGFSRLELSRISKSSATQRAGRAARQFPGKAYRLWSLHDELSMPVDEVPEIQRADLTEGLLFLGHQGVRDFQKFSWFEAPAKPLLNAAVRSLKALGALDADGVLTGKGQKLLRYPLPPRLASLMVTAQEREAPTQSHQRELAARIAALLQERDFIRDDTARDHLGDRLECDLTLRLHLMDRFRPPAVLAGLSQLRRLLKIKETGLSVDPEHLRVLLLSAFPDRLCRRRGKSDRGLMVGGRGVRLSASSLVKESEFFIALQGMEGSGEAETQVSLACGMDKEFVLQHLGQRLQKSSDLFFDEDKAKIFAREFRSFEGLPLDEPTLTIPNALALAEKMPDLLVDRMELVLKKNEELSQWWDRWQFLKKHQPSLDWEWESASLKEVFAEASFGKHSMDEILRQNLVYFFEKSLPPKARDLLHEVPSTLKVPSGNHLRIRYPPDKDPFLEVRLQEVFGWSETPLILKKFPLTLHLLGPNFRPVQVTSDLSSFWKNAYPEVRSELRARYPKHSWPDDPLTAPAVSKGRPRR